MILKYLDVHGILICYNYSLMWLLTKDKLATKLTLQELFWEACCFEMQFSTFINRTLFLQCTLDRNFPIHVVVRGKKPREIKILITAIRRKHGSMYFDKKFVCRKRKKCDSMLSGETRKHYSENKIECCLMKRSKKKKEKMCFFAWQEYHTSHETKKTSFFCWNN